MLVPGAAASGDWIENGVSNGSWPLAKSTITSEMACHAASRSSVFSTTAVKVGAAPDRPGALSAVGADDRLDGRPQMTWIQS
jgi:hypothetical protein